MRIIIRRRSMAQRNYLCGGSCSYDKSYYFLYGQFLFERMLKKKLDKQNHCAYIIVRGS